MISQIAFLNFVAYAYAVVLSIIPTFPQQYKGFRYSLLYDNETKVNYTDAYERCREHGAHLISFHSLDEVNFVRHIEKSNLTWIEDTWMGLTISVTGTGRTYKWEDGTRFDFKNFAPGEPKNLGSGKFCGQIKYKEDEQFGKWKIANCSDQINAYTCKKPNDGKTWGILAPVEGTDFPHKFKQHQYMVMYVAEKVNFVQARLKCEDMDANLASLHSREEIEFLKRVMRSNSTLMEDAWIGMVYNVTDTSAYTAWIDGSPYDYRYTAPGEPKYSEKGEYCGQTIGKEDCMSKWKVVNCTDVAYTFVCKKPWIVPKGPNGEDIDPKFPHDFKANKYAIIVGNRNVTFVQARMECEGMGGNLASIHSEEEAEFLKGIVQSNSTLMEDAWIGMVYSVSSTDVKKTWVDESPFDYSNFAPLESKFSTEGVYCGQIIGNGDKFSKWKIVDCSEEAHTYVCKKTSPPKPATPAPTNAPTARPPPRRTWPPPPPPTLPPPEDTTTEPATDIPNPDPATCDPDPTTPDSEVPPECRPVYISEYDQTVKEKGCYPV
ncbi:hypothetical protein Aduo_014055 [Ancylostoma duodenale]